MPKKWTGYFNITKMTLIAGISLLGSACGGSAFAQTVAPISQADMLGSSAIVGQIVDYTITDTDKRITAILVIGSAVGNKKCYKAEPEAKLAAAGLKGPEVMIGKLGAGTRVFCLYGLKAVKPSPETITKIQKDKGKTAVHDPSIALDYTSIRLEPNRGLIVANGSIKNLGEVVNIVNPDGLYLRNKSAHLFGTVGSKYWRMTLDQELRERNYEEAKAIYAALDLRNKDSNHLDVVKITRKTNLSKFYHASESLRPFVEAEMVLWNYDDVQKAAVRKR